MEKFHVHKEKNFCNTCGFWYILIKLLIKYSEANLRFEASPLSNTPRSAKPTPSVYLQGDSKVDTVIHHPFSERFPGNV